MNKLKGLRGIAKFLYPPGNGWAHKEILYREARNRDQLCKGVSWKQLDA